LRATHSRVALNAILGRNQVHRPKGALDHSTAGVSGRRYEAGPAVPRWDGVDDGDTASPHRTDHGFALVLGPRSHRRKLEANPVRSAEQLHDRRLIDVREIKVSPPRPQVQGRRSDDMPPTRVQLVLGCRPALATLDLTPLGPWQAAWAAGFRPHHQVATG
jgi:hypothetical protein